MSYVTQEQITQAIDDTLATKATALQLDSATQGKLLQADLPGYGSGKLQRSTLNQANGPVGLVNGRVPTNYMPSITGGRPWKFLGATPSWSITGLTTRVIDVNPWPLATWTLPNLGYNYIPLFIGACQIGGPAGGEIQIRKGSETGPIYARAVSANTANYDGCGIVPAGGVSPISQATTFHIVGGKKFSGGNASVIGVEYNLGCWAVPA